MTIIDNLARALESWPVREGSIVVAVSGGADSIALLHALAEVVPRRRLVCAHVNQKLRGLESDEDARFVEEHASRHRFSCRIAVAPPADDTIRDRGVEAAARRARYRALQVIRKQVGAHWLATAHTIDDQAETVLLRLLTAAPVETLSGIRPRTDDGLIRPLIHTRRHELHEWLSARDLPHRTDSTNRDERFLRNRIRLRLLPRLQEFDENVVDRLARIAEHVRAIRDVAGPALDRIAEAWQSEPDRSTIPVENLPPAGDLRRMTLLREIRRLIPDGREVDSDRLQSLVEELRNSSRVSLGNHLDAALVDDKLVLEIEPENVEPFESPIRCGRTIHLSTADATIRIERLEHAEEFTDQTRTRQVFALPDHVVDPTFTIRNRRPGDRFQPLGLGHEKKLKDVLIDRKVPADLRDRIPLLLFDDEIVWIPGVEVSERFRVTPGRDLFEVRIDYGQVTRSENR